jgi:ComF family protein
MVLDLVLSVLWPARCAACGAFVREGTSFCPPCASALVWLGPCCSGCAMPLREEGQSCGGCRQQPFPFAAARAALAYGGSLTQALLRFKHGGHRHLAAPLARYLAPAVSSFWRQADLVCPVPLHPRRLRKRGFNQAFELLRTVRQDPPDREKHKLVCNVLARRFDTPSLGHGSPADRARVVAGAFAVPRTNIVAGKSILVADDVMTSGATLAECARVLLAAGASRVWVAALARAL